MIPGDSRVYKGIHKLSLDPMSADTDTGATTSSTLPDDNSIGLFATVPPQSPDPLVGVKWASNVITWSFAAANLPGQQAAFSGPIANGAEAALVEKAAAMWESVSGIDLVLVADSASVEIRVGFEALNSAGGGPVGLTNWSSANGNFVPDVTVGVEDPGQLGITQLPDGDFVYNGFLTTFFQTAAHEFGHALGLAHNTTDDQALMWPVGQATNRSIDPNDAVAIQQLYGANSAGDPTVSLTDNGPEAFTVGANMTVNPFANLVVTDGPGLRELVTITLAGGGTLSDPTAGTDAAFSNGVFTESGDNLTSANLAQSILNRLVFSAGSSGGHTSFNVEVDNSLLGSATDGTIAVDASAPTQGAGIGILDTTTGQPVAAAAEPYTGPVAGLQEQYINITNDSLNISVSTPNWFVHSVAAAPMQLRSAAESMSSTAEPPRTS
jgi:Matrixin